MIMKKRIFGFIILWLLATSTGAAQDKKNCQKCGVKKTTNILVTYEHTAAKSDFPKPFVYKIETTLIINDSVAQYNYNKKNQNSTFRSLSNQSRWATLY